MRILIINSEHPPVGGGAGNASMHIAQAMVADGHEVTVLTSKFKGQPWQEMQAGVRILRAPSIRRRMDRSTAFEQVAFIFGGMMRALFLVFNWRPDAVLAFFGVPSGVIAAPLKTLFGIPYIVSLRGGDVPGFRPYDFALHHRLIGPLLRVIWRNAGAVVANSSGLRDLGHDFDPTVRIRIISNGVNAQRFVPGERNWETIHNLFVGRLVYQKGLDLLFEALSRLRAYDWDLTIVGDGPERTELISLAEQKGILDRIRFTGWLRKPDLVKEYQLANVFPYPSRHEGMPNAVLEAMAAGLPIIASRIAGNEELVVDGETGTLVEPENASELEQALVHFYENVDLRKKFGEAGRARVIKHYPWARVAQQYTTLLERILHD